MANYINSEILAEAYTHLEIDLYEDKVKLATLKQELTTFFHERASFLFGTDVEIKIEFEEGSLKTKIIAIGSAAATIVGVLGSYGDFRQSVNQLANDATSLAQSANMEVIFRTKTPHCDRLRIEKRKGVFGRVASLLNDLDAVSSKLSESKLPTNNVRLNNANKVTDSLIAWEADTNKLFLKFEDPETIACVADGLLAELKKMPRSFPWQRELSQPGFRAQIVDADSNFSGAVAGASARYAATLKSVEKKLEDRSAISVAKVGS